MLKQFRKKWRLFIVLIVYIISILSGCAHSNDNASNSKVDNEKNHSNEEITISGSSDLNMDLIYEYTLISESVILTEIYDIATNGEWLYVYGYTLREPGDGSTDVCRDMQIVGIKLGDSEAGVVYKYTEVENLQGNISYSTGYGIQIENMTVTDEGELIVIISERSLDVTNYRVNWIAQDGTVMWTASIENAESVGTPVIKEPLLYVPCDNQILVYDSNGNLQQRYILDTFPAGIDINNMNSVIESVYVTENDGVYAVFLNSQYSLRYIFRIDEEIGKMTEWAETAGAWYADLIGGPGKGYELLFKDNKGIYGWNFENPEMIELVNFLDSGLVGQNIKKICPVSEDKYIMLYQNEDGQSEIYYLTKADPEVMKEREVIVLGLLSKGNNYIQKIVKFNQANKQYMIKVVDYTEYNDPLTQLNLDITTDNAPDIFYADANTEVPFVDYARAGYLEDIKPWLESDGELKLEDYLYNVFEAMGLNGKWYQMPTAIQIYAYVGSSSVFGGNQTWTLEDYNKLKGEGKDTTVLWGSREELMRDALVFRWNQFVNEEAGTCSFNSEEFVELLAWLNTFPIQNEIVAIDINEVRNGKILSLKTQFRDFSNFNTNLERLYQGAAEFICFPSSETNGGMFVASGVTLAMSAQSDCKEGAWEFIRYFFTDEYQIDELGAVTDQLPIKLSALDALADKAMNPDFGILDSYRLNGREITVEAPTKEKVDGWMEYLKSITCADTLDNDIYNIITEETGYYFAGQKTAEMTAEIIQSRVGIYLAERQ